MDSMEVESKELNVVSDDDDISIVGVFHKSPLKKRKTQNTDLTPTTGANDSTKTSRIEMATCLIRNKPQNSGGSQIPFSFESRRFYNVPKPPLQNRQQLSKERPSIIVSKVENRNRMTRSKKSDQEYTIMEPELPQNGRSEVGNLDEQDEKPILKKAIPASTAAPNVEPAAQNVPTEKGEDLALKIVESPPEVVKLEQHVSIVQRKQRVLVRPGTPGSAIAELIRGRGQSTLLRKDPEKNCNQLISKCLVILGEKVVPQPENPLHNDKILKAVLSHLNPSDLKICRRVCKTWLNSSSQIFKRRGYVTLKECTAVTEAEFMYNLDNPLYGGNGFHLLLTDKFLNDIRTSRFLPIYAGIITRLKLESHFEFPSQKLCNLLPSNLPNLEHLELKFPCELLCSSSNQCQNSDNLNLNLDPPEDEDFGLLSPTRLKCLKIHCQCSICPRIPSQARSHRSHFQQGLLVRLLQNSPELQVFEFSEDKSLQPNKNLMRQLVHLVNSTNLKELQHLTINSTFLQDLQISQLVPGTQLKSLNLNGLIWKQVETLWFQHLHSLESITIGALIDNLDTKFIAAFVFENVLELIVQARIDERLLGVFSDKCFPTLKKLELHNPGEEVVVYIWKNLIQLQELVLDFSVQSEKFKVLHLDSLLSGLSINNCESILRDVIRNGLPVPFDFDTKSGLTCSIQNLRCLQKLVIRSTNSMPYRITEVGLVLVLLKMKSLTSVTINSCDLLAGTMKYILENISKGIYLCITSSEMDMNYTIARNSLFPQIEN